jgi:hypothetical protein
VRGEKSAIPKDILRGHDDHMAANNALDHPFPNKRDIRPGFYESREEDNKDNEKTF